MSLQAGSFNMQQGARRRVLVLPKVAPVTSHGYWMRQRWMGRDWGGCADQLEVRGMGLNLLSLGRQ